MKKEIKSINNLSEEDINDIFQNKSKKVFFKYNDEFSIGRESTGLFMVNNTINTLCFIPTIDKTKYNIHYSFMEGVKIYTEEEIDELIKEYDSNIIELKGLKETFKQI